MPVLVIGADTKVGEAVVRSLARRDGELRAFITDPTAADSLRALGVKVAIGDVSDASHISGAALRAFAAVIIAECGRDDRERAFAASPAELNRGWAEGLAEAGVQRIIWVGPVSEPPGPLQDAAPELVAIDTSGRVPDDIAAEVARADDAASLD